MVYSYDLTSASCWLTDLYSILASFFMLSSSLSKTSSTAFLMAALSFEYSTSIVLFRFLLNSSMVLLMFPISMFILLASDSTNCFAYRLEDWKFSAEEALC